MDTLNIDSTRLQDIPELVKDIDFSQFQMPVVVNQRVLEQIYHLAYRVPRFTGNSLNRQHQYREMILSKITEKNLPPELLYLPLVESGYKTAATSHARAGGVWQFIPSTARIYKMKMDWWIDERRSPEKSTEAGLSYLDDLYEEFGDWYLAMAAYNCGSGCVRRRIRNQNTRDYWQLDLPKETKHYVPRILAAIIIGSFLKNTVLVNGSVNKRHFINQAVC